MTTPPPDHPDRPQGGGRHPPPPPPHAPGGYFGPAPLNPNETQLWVLGAHLGPLVLWFLAPLVVMLAVGERSPYVRRQAVEALNFQLSFMIYFAISAFLMVLLIGFLLLFVLAIAWLVMMVVAAVQSAGGQEYRYPLTIRFIS